MRNAIVPPTSATVINVTIPSLSRLTVEKTVLAYGNETAEAWKPVRVNNEIKTVRPSRRRAA